MYRPTFKHIAEYHTLRFIAALVRVLPYKGALFLGWMIGYLIFHVFRFRRRQGEERLQEVFGEQFTQRERRHILWTSWRNLCFNIVEIARMPMITRSWLDTHGNTEVIQEFKRQTGKKGAVLAVPHMGNWDLAGIAASVFDIPIFFIARRQKNQLVDRYLNRMRGVTGGETVLSDDQQMLRKVVKKIKEGKTFAILPDVRTRTQALKIDFLGGTAHLAAGMALFARMADVPICVATSRRNGWSQHQWTLHESIQPDRSLSKEDDWQRMTQHVMTIFDNEIRQAPEQYFWFNKRWVLDPLS